LVIAILACGGALFFANKLGGIRDGLAKDKQNLTADKNRLTADLAARTEQLNNTQQKLAKTSEELTTTVGLLEAEKIKFAQKTQEADNCKQTVADRTRELEQAKTELTAAQENMKKIQDSLAEAGIEDIKSIEQLRDKIVAQTEENKILGRQLLVMRDENLMLKQKVEELSITPVNLRGTIAEVRDNWGFVVLDLGKNQRVQTNTNFLVYRDTKLIGKVQVRSVGQTTSVAEVLPEFQRAALRVGDLVVH
jgi:hypothetical protein